jgi:hypothetical protein
MMPTASLSSSSPGLSGSPQPEGARLRGHLTSRSSGQVTAEAAPGPRADLGCLAVTAVAGRSGDSNGNAAAAPLCSHPPDLER